MSIYSNVTEQDLITLRKLAEQQKIQRALKTINRIKKKTHDNILAESLSPITKKSEEFNESTRKIGEIVKKSHVEDGNTQTSAIEIITGTQSIRDTLAFRKKIRNFLKLEEKPNGRMFWNDVFIKAIGEMMVDIIGKEYDYTTGIQNFFIKTKHTFNNLKENEETTVYQILKYVSFFNMKHTIGIKSARMQDAIKYLPKATERFLNPPLPLIENIEDSYEDESDKLQGEGVKFIIPSSIIDIYTRLEVLLGLKLYGPTDTLTEASNLRDELYKRRENQNEQQYQNASNNFSTQ